MTTTCTTCKGTGHFTELRGYDSDEYDRPCPECRGETYDEWRRHYGLPTRAQQDRILQDMRAWFKDPPRH